MGATCPVGDCGYSGAPASVEAHISGSTTGEHVGRLGREMRGEIERGLPWAKLALFGGFLLALYLAQRGDSDPPEEDSDDYQETAIVDPTEPALVEEATR